MKFSLRRGVRAAGALVALFALSTSGLPTMALASDGVTPDVSATVSGVAKLYAKVYELSGRTVFGHANAPRPNDFDNMLGALPPDKKGLLTEMTGGRDAIDGAIHAANSLLAADPMSLDAPAPRAGRPKREADSRHRSTKKAQPRRSSALAAVAGQLPVGMEEPRETEEIQEPPAPFSANPPVEEPTLVQCLGPSAGGNGGHNILLPFNLVYIGLEAFGAFIPEEIEVSPPPAPNTAPNPGKGFWEAGLSLYRTLIVGVEFPLEEFEDCEALNTFRLNANTENTQIQLYNLLKTTNTALEHVNEGHRVLEDQIDLEQHSVQEIRRLRIQQGLTATVGSAVNLSHALPESQGGFIDSEPVGVRKIVRDALDHARAVGIAITAAAPVYLAQADVALANHKYVDAYRMYQRAYQALSVVTTTQTVAEDGSPMPTINGPERVDVADRKTRRAVHFDLSGGQRFECSLDGKRFENCASAYDTPSLGTGTHTLRVRIRGTSDATPPEAAKYFRIVAKH